MALSRVTRNVCVLGALVRSGWALVTFLSMTSSSLHSVCPISRPICRVIDLPPHQGGGS